MNEFNKEIMEDSLLQSKESLLAATKAARNARDIEALIVISERWVNLAVTAKELDKKSGFMLGFTSSENEETDE